MQSPMAPTDGPDAEMIEVLERAGLIESGQSTSLVPLAGGVSSDIWKVETGSRVFCVKRALPKLKVRADWFAPVERSRFEVAWYRIADGIAPGSAPRVLFHDDAAMLFAMEFLAPVDHELWKTALRAGRADPAQAADVGQRLSRIHARTAGVTNIVEQFPRTDIFQAIRLEPYLEATAAKHPDLGAELVALSRRTAAIRTVMIHGDVSPKNILIGPKGPVFLDAECACMGDPAFDLAFCLNHLLLKCLWTPAARSVFLASFDAMASAYLAGVDWEDREALEARVASLLPGLFLARVDGKSPVEYITAEADRDKVRRCARSLLVAAPSRVAEVRAAWNGELCA